MGSDGGDELIRIAPQKGEPTGYNRDAFRFEGGKRTGKWTGGEAEETGLRRRTSGADRDTGYQVEGGKE